MAAGLIKYEVKLPEPMCMRVAITIFLVFSAVCISDAQDVIERDYFPNAQARNAAIAAARYAEEGYYYSRFTTYVNAVDSSRIFADTALFFVKRSLMLCDTSLVYAPAANTGAVDYLLSGKEKTTAADTVLREVYPMTDIKSHHFFGREAANLLSTAVMEYFSASLLLKPEDDSEATAVETYDVLPFDDEVLRLEADETTFQHLANGYETDLFLLEGLAGDIKAEVNKTKDQKTRAKLREWLDELNQQITSSASYLEDASHRIREIRFLLNQKYLKDLENAESPEHLSQFETSATPTGEVEIDEDLPDGLVYKIQLGYYPSDVDINNFHGLFPISGETVKEGLTRFYAGLFYSYVEAGAGLEFVRKNAIANAFIVPYHNGKKVGMSRAVEIEKARGVK